MRVQTIVRVAMPDGGPRHYFCVDHEGALVYPTKPPWKFGPMWMADYLTAGPREAVRRFRSAGAEVTFERFDMDAWVAEYDAARGGRA